MEAEATHPALVGGGAELAIDAPCLAPGQTAAAKAAHAPWLLTR